MKILVFEYICGGGFAGQALPPSLEAEGRMMLQALLDDLKSVGDLTLIVPLDRRCTDFSLPPATEVVPIAEDGDIVGLLPELIERCDTVWPIAPETDGLLANIACMVVAENKRLLLSSPETVRLCGDKLATYRTLSAWHIPVVETFSLAENCLDAEGFGRCVIKPRDGVGCLGTVIVDNRRSYLRSVAEIESPDRYVVQPYCEGRALSLSCLFKHGQGWLVCCNRQQIEIVGEHFVLNGCLVNIANLSRDYYQRLVERVAEAMPGLWGYVGIDLIETPDLGPLVLEINPRLTTSYVGIRQATGINIAEQVLRLPETEPEFSADRNQTVNIVIH